MKMKMKMRIDRIHCLQLSLDLTTSIIINFYLFIIDICIDLHYY